MRHSISSIAACALIATTSCRDEDETIRTHRSAQSLISDEAHGGRSGFLWSPPMVPSLAPIDSPFVAGLDPLVQITTLGPGDVDTGIVATFTRTTGHLGQRLYQPAGHEYYAVAWDTRAFALNTATTYRIRAFIQGEELGIADVDLVADRTEMWHVQKDHFIPLLDGRTLSIRFRIEQQAVDGDADGVLNWADNCPSTANPGQEDLNQDGIGDACQCIASACDDGNPCTIHSCAANGCTHAHAADGPFAGSHATSCGLGACSATGQTECLAGVVVDTCSAAVPSATDETCDGVDDDCDGATDENYVAVETTCGVGACAAEGIRSCVNGIVENSCVPEIGASIDATCDDADEDCDGEIDEDYVALATNCGIGACASMGSTSCAEGVVVDSCAPGIPTVDDTCDQIDDDCNGIADDGFVSAQTTCGLGSCAATGLTACIAGSIVDSCIAGEPAPSDESCDALDNDCDGATDEDYVVLATSCGVGACASSGTTSCVDGAVHDSCVPGSAASSDATCDAIDDNCNGQVDEEYAAFLTACGEGECASTGSTSCLDGVVIDGCVAQSPCFEGVLIPRDPSEVAPPLDLSAATPVGPSTEFLYTGDNPIQQGVEPGTIEPARASVTRGLVLGADGTPLPGVTITILDRPEYGTTRSRVDGMFDLAVNGGGSLVINYEAPGHFPVQRRITPDIQEYARVPDVVMTPIDPIVTVVSLNAPAMQVARGSISQDEDGVRQATLVIPAGTTATLRMPDGSTQPVSTLSVRLTEYTVGPDGPNAMPGELPPATGYTYAVELSADEAIAAGANGVDFSQNLYFYVDDFLNIPAGEVIPLGFYDRTIGAWVPQRDGQTVRILSVTGGLANLDISGTGAPATEIQLSALGISQAEREHLAALYTPGQSLWRAPIAHFTPFDCNLPFRVPTDAVSPPSPRFVALSEHVSCETDRTGSIIGCENQSLGERIPVAGTPFDLHYQSNRSPGRRAGIQIPLSGSSLPASLRRIDLEIHLAGQTVRRSFPPVANQTFDFYWDHRDAYGRAMASARGLVRVGYVYQAVTRRQATINGGRSFGLPSSSNVVFDARSQAEATFWQQELHGFEGIDHGATGLGGWSITPHHAYDPITNVLYFGNGKQRSAAPLDRAVIPIAGRGFGPISPNSYSGPASDLGIHSVRTIARDSTGAFYIVDGAIIRKIDSAGNVTLAAGCVPAPGVGCASGIAKEGRPFSEVTVSAADIALDAHDRLYIAEQNFIWRIRSGVFERIAGNGSLGGATPSNALSVGLAAVRALAFDREGNLVFNWGDQIYRIDHEGILSRFSSGICLGNLGCEPSHLAFDESGNLYVAVRGAPYIRRVATDGRVTTVVRYLGESAPRPPDVVLQTEPVMGNSSGELVVDSLGNVIFGDGPVLRQLSTDGFITRIAGNNQFGAPIAGQPVLDARFPISNLSPANAEVFAALLIGSRNVIYAGFPAANTSSLGATGRLYAFAKPFPIYTNDELMVPSEDGEQIYRFDRTGRHLSTLSVRDGHVVYAFTYAGSRLASITDADGNTTLISTTPGAVTIGTPFGVPTSLALDSNDRLASVANAAGEVTHFVYDANGLLVSLQSPRGHLTTFEYDSEGRLTRDEDPLGGFTQLSRSGDVGSFSVSVATAEGRTTVHSISNPIGGGQNRSTIEPAGVTTTTNIARSGATTSITAPDGTVTANTLGPDPRFGMLAPIAQLRTVTTPSGVVSTTARSRAAVLSDPTDLLSLVTQTDNVTINGRTFTTIYDAATRTEVTTTPAGRQSTTVIDALGRVIELRPGGLSSTFFAYDSHGRLSSITRGTGLDVRVHSMTYAADGFIDSMTAPVLGATSFVRDPVGRVLNSTLPGARSIAYEYDGNGNRTGLSPPGRPQHAFDYDERNIETTYSPPDIGLAEERTLYATNLDREPTRVTRPDGREVITSYDSAGRVSTVASSELGYVPDRTLTYSYSPTTGQLRTIAASDGQTLSYTYDGSLLLSTTWSGHVNGVVSQTYDANFRMSSQSVNGVPVNFDYDADGLLIQAGDLAIVRDPVTGLIVSTTLGGVQTNTNVQTTISYAVHGEMESKTASLGNSQIYSLELVRDASGRIIQKVEALAGAAETVNYLYDTSGRLWEAESNGLTTSYSYDMNGNRISETDASGVSFGVYDDQDRITTYGAATYLENAMGDLAVAVNSGTTETRYDVFGSLRRIIMPNGSEIEYVVDGQNRRVAKLENGAIVQQFIYADELRPITELDGSGAVVSRFVYGTQFNAPDYMIRGNANFAIISDHLERRTG